jgi:hypothetical protein
MLPAILGAAQGLTGVISGAVGLRKANQEAKTAQADYDKRMQQYQALDTSNPYANLENVMEDLTINQQAADMANQQQQQALANTMGGMQQAAGGSGVAALAQAMAGQQSQNLQTAAASIGQQESANQKARLQQAAQIQSAEREGDIYSRKLQADKTETLLGMAQGRLGAAKQAQAEAKGALVGGVGDLATAGLSGAMGTQRFQEWTSGSKAGESNVMGAFFGNPYQG